MKTYYLKIRDKFITDIKNRVKKHEYIRAVYSKYPTVLKVLDYKPFTHKVTLDELRNCGIVDKYSGPRPFTFITREQFGTIYKLGMEE